MTRRRRLSSAALILSGTLIGLALTQVSMLLRIGNGVSEYGDAYSEANAFRAAEFYAAHGFTHDAGLPHIVHGAQFPDEGWVRDMDRQPLPRGVYTHYPPLPDWICGLLEIAVGRTHRWAWRLLPITVGLLALLGTYQLLRPALGPVPASLVVALVGMAPATASHLHGLHYQGYAYALVLLQFALTANVLLRNGHQHASTGVALGALGFFQGWLSFDHAFVVGLMAVPLFFVAWWGGERPGHRRVALAILVPVGGFLLAHLLHLMQVAAFYGSFALAVQDLGTGAISRSVGSGGVGYSLGVLALTAALEYARLLLLSPGESPFSVLLPAVVVLAGALPLLAPWLRRPGDKDAPRTGATLPHEGWPLLAAIGSAFAVSGTWLVIMPAHAVVHTHIVPRLFVLPYLTCCLLLALAWRMNRAPDGGAD